MDYLDVVNPKPRHTATARYFSEPVDGPDIGAQSFNYSYVNPYSETYRRLFANIQAAAGEVAIKTSDQHDYRVNGIVILPDGKAFKILQVETDFQASPKQAFRLFATPVATEYVIRMVSVPNPWGIV